MLDVCRRDDGVAEAAGTLDRGRDAAGPGDDGPQHPQIFGIAIQCEPDESDAEQRRVLEDALRYGLQALGGSEIGLR